MNQGMPSHHVDKLPYDVGHEMGRVFLVLGVVFLLVGVFLSFGLKIPFLGRLPGDIRIEKDNFHFYFSLASSILVSLILTVLLRLFRRS